MLTITRKDLLLTINDNVIPAMGSSDVPVKFVNDIETYQGFLIEPRVGYYVNGCPKSTVCEYDISSNIIKIPAEAFKQRGVLVIAIALIDNEDSNHIEVTKELALEVTPAPDGTVILPATETWQTAVSNLVEQLYNQDYKPLYDKALEDINEAVQTANTASENADLASQNVQTAYENLGDYKVENGILYFMKADGTYNEQGITLAGQSTVTDVNSNPILTAPLTAPQNLLVNGDFRVNQRGQNSYSANDPLIYTIDNWAITNGNLSISNQIVTLTANVLTYDCWLWQFLDQSVFNSDIATCLIELSDGIHIQQLQINQSGETQEYVLNSKTKIHFKWDSRRNKYRFVIYVLNGNSESINYICLYNGQIAYPHIAEDDAIALIRCMKKIQSLVDFTIGGRLILFLSNGSNVLQGTQFFMPMDSVPTVESIEIMYSNGQSAKGITATSTKNEITKIDINDSDLFENSYAYLNKLIVTCEPL